MQGKPGNVIPAGVTASITIVDGPDRGRRKTLRARRLVIGRKTGDLVLRDSKISSTHAAVEFVGGHFMLYDLSSTNGSFVNDERVNERRLANLDEIRIGFTTLLFQVSIKEKPKHPKKKETADLPAGEESQTEIDSEAGLSSLVEENISLPEAKKIYIKFTIRSGPHRGQVMDSSKESIVIGRVNSDILLKEDKDVSRKHAVVEVISGDQTFVRDLASTNGTFVNDKRISSSRIKGGDQIRVGQTVLDVAVEVVPLGRKS